MEQIKNLGPTLAPALQENTGTFKTENIASHPDSQQLTSWMLEIITFQMQEQALFADFENYTNSLN